MNQIKFASLVLLLSIGFAKVIEVDVQSIHKNNAERVA
jgi:hypothetical protein